MRTSSPERCGALRRASRPCAPLRGLVVEQRLRGVESPSVGSLRTSGLRPLRRSACERGAERHHLHRAIARQYTDPVAQVVGVLRSSQIWRASAVPCRPELRPGGARRRASLPGSGGWQALAERLLEVELRELLWLERADTLLQRERARRTPSAWRACWWIGRTTAGETAHCTSSSRPSGGCVK